MPNDKRGLVAQLAADGWQDGWQLARRLAVGSWQTVGIRYSSEFPSWLPTVPTVPTDGRNIHTHHRNVS